MVQNFCVCSAEVVRARVCGRGEGEGALLTYFVNRSHAVNSVDSTQKSLSLSVYVYKQQVAKSSVCSSP